LESSKKRRKREAKGELMMSKSESRIPPKDRLGSKPKPVVVTVEKQARRVSLESDEEEPPMRKVNADDGARSLSITVSEDRRRISEETGDQRLFEDWFGKKKEGNTAPVKLKRVWRNDKS